MVVRAAGTGTINFKYIFFRGDPVFNNFGTSGNSTLVGQANAAGAMAVGAAAYFTRNSAGAVNKDAAGNVIFTNDSTYSMNTPVMEKFSSAGGTPVYVNNSPTPVIRQKPDFAAPDGVNTSVDFASLNVESDGLPISSALAAAPHAAGVAALILEAKQKYYGSTFSPVAGRSRFRKGNLRSSALSLSGGT
jgi:hypothetical protein